MKFSVLGNVEVHDGDQFVGIPTARARMLLAGLLVHVNRVVPVGDLAEILWGDHPPQSVRQAVQLNVVRLRRALGDSAHEMVRTRPGGYMIELRPNQLDLLDFRRLVAEGRAALDLSKRSELLRSALDLWHGRPLSDVPSGLLQRDIVPPLVDEYVAACEHWADAELDLGRHADVIPVLRMVTLEHPASEHLWGKLMVALYRSGRQGDALEVYRTLYRYLDDYLGVEPSTPLRELHDRMLKADHELDGSRFEPVRAVQVPTWKAQQLPRSIARLYGREEHIRMLDRLLRPDHDPGSPSTGVAVITGPAGVGKTALASFWAHRVLGDFADGQLFVNLAGVGPTGRIVTLGEALRYCLEGLGVPADRMPSKVAGQIALYRSLLAGKRVLLVFDDAHDAQQVRALLPGSPGCVAVVTSRNRLSGLVATEGTLLVALAQLHEHDARSLLADRIGADRVAAERDAADAVVAACAGLPLALAVVASRAVYHQPFSLRELADELATTRDGLDAFASEDPCTDIRSVFQSSYVTLTADSARLFRLLALRFGAEIGVAPAASLAGVELPSARERLGELAGLHMVTEQRHARYALHDLLQAYAGELARTNETDEERRATVSRLLDHYLHSAHAAAHLLHPQRDPIAIGRPGTGVTVESLVSLDAALAWFDQEYPALLEAVEQAGSMGLDKHVWQIAAAVQEYLDRRGHWPEVAATQQAGLRAAERVGDLAAQVLMLRNLGPACARLGDFESAYGKLTRALRISSRLARPRDLGHTYRGLSWVAGQQFHHRRAVKYAERALAAYEQADHQLGRASALNDIGWANCQLGEYKAAVDNCEQSLTLFEEIDSLHGQAASHQALGHTYHRLAELEHAEIHLRRALTLYQRLGVRYHEAQTLNSLADTYAMRGNSAAAEQSWQRALSIMESVGHVVASDLDSERTRNSSNGPSAIFTPPPYNRAR